MRWLARPLSNHLTLLTTLCCVSWSSLAVAVRPGRGSRPSQLRAPARNAAAPSLQSPSDVIGAYYKEHSAGAVRDENETNPAAICGRRYVSQVCHGPERFGNEMGEFLNGFAVAIVTNRTLLLHEGTCLAYLNLTVGILDLGEAKAMHRRAGCNLPAPVMISSSDALQSYAFDQDARQHISTRFWHQPLATKAMKNPSLGQAARERLGGLFGAGAFLGYHALFSQAFAWKGNVRAPVDHLLRDLPEGTGKIGLHVRHGISCTDGCPLLDEKAIKCVRRVARQLAPQPECALLLATDRTASLARISEGARSLAKRVDEKDQLLRLEHQLTNATGCRVVRTVYAERLAGLARNPDHGPWTDDTAMMDMYMLSQSDIILLSLRHSSFSERAGELFATGPEKLGRIYEWESCTV